MLFFRRAIIAALFLSTALPGFAQKNKYKDYFTEGNFLLMEENYLKALEEYKKAYKLDSTNANINFKIGYCYLFHPIEKHLAEDYLSKAVKDVSDKYKEDDPLFKQAPYYALFYYGQALHLDYKFDEALKYYDLYETHIDKKKFKADIDLLQHYRNMVKAAKDKTSTPVNILITNTGDSINSEFAEFSPVISADERVMMYTYRGNKSTGAAEGFKTDDGRYYEDIFVSYKNEKGIWSEGKPLENVNSNGHDGAVSLSPDGQSLIIYRDDAGDGNLYYSNWSGTDWSIPLKFGPEINSKSWEPSACYTPDGNILFFVSDRPGGLGGRDIYRCRKLPNGKWSLPQNLGPKINTEYDEDCPFVHPNGKDFYFSSEGHSTMGGYDIMVSEMDADGNLNSDVVSMPYPINTTDDDVFYVTTADSRRAYYASAHEDRTGYGEKDIYLISLVDNKDQELLALLKGQFIAPEGEKLPEGLEVIVTDKNSGDMVGIYRPQRSGTFTTILQPGKDYVISYQQDGKEFQTEDLAVLKKDAFQEINREVFLKPVQLPSTQKHEDMLLDVNVILKGVKETPVAGAKIQLTEKGGTPQTFTADAKGKYQNIKILSGKNYELKAFNGENASDLMSFSTSGLNIKKLNKILYLAEETPVVSTGGGDRARFINYFTYNKNKVEGNPDYEKFLGDLETSLKADGKAVITINSSASKVPTTQFGGSNLRLAQTRAENLKKELMAYLQKKGISLKGITFKLNPSVGGPEYKGDYIINRKEFEKFQFVEAIVK
jgi:hypothetical protein